MSEKFFEKIEKSREAEETAAKEKITLESIKEALPFKKETKLYLKTVVLYEKGMKDSNEYIRRGTAQSLAALAPVNPELFRSLYEKGLKDPDEYVRRGTAQSLAALAKEIKIPGQESMNQENLKSLINTYGFSSRREDKEFFRIITPLFKKELPLFLESKALPRVLKYHIKCGLIEILNKGELLDYFKQAVADFNSAAKSENQAAKNERRLILEFLSLLPISESSNFLSAQAQKLIPELGSLKSIEMRTFKALADTNSREANKLLFSIMSQDDLAARRKEYIFRKLVQNKVLEEDLLGYLGVKRQEKESFFRALKEFQKQLPGIIPSASLLDLHFNRGLSFAEIKEKESEFEKEDSSFSEIITKLAQDKDLAAIYFALFPSSHRYDNILSFEKFQELLEETEGLAENNKAVKKQLSSLWQKQERTPKKISQFLEIIEKGAPASEEVIRGREEEEKEKLKEVSLETIGNFTKNLANLEPIFALSGRLEGFLRKDKEKLEEIQQKIKTAADYLDPTSDAVFRSENLEPLYHKLYQEYQNILRARGQEKILSQEELYQEDRNKFLALLQKEAIFSPEIVINRQRNLKEISQFVSESILNRLEQYSRKPGKISEKFSILINDLKGEMKTSLENLKLKMETKPLRLTFEQVPKFDFQGQKRLIEFMRIGDARESCIATNGSNSWSIPHYLKDFGTVGFLILEQDKAVGHIIGHLGKDNLDNPVLLVNGIYIKGNYPPQAISQRAALYLEDFAQKAGLTEVLLAYSSHADSLPPGYEKTSKIVQRFQGTEGNLYSDFKAPTEHLDSVKCYQRSKRELPQERK